jgi:fatty acid desaturase
LLSITPNHERRAFELFSRLEFIMSTPNTIAGYARQLRPHLSSAVFVPARSRLWWLPVHVTIVVIGTCALAAGRLYWPIALLVAATIGLSFAGLTFLGHETLHGGVVRQRGVRWLVGFVGFLPFVVSPRIWVSWHNRVHHGNTNRSGADPDAYPTLEEYHSDRSVRWAMDYFAPGLGRLRGLASLLVGFSVQSGHMLVVAGKRGYLPRAEHRRAIAETLLGVACWALLAFVIGARAFMLSFALPLVLANATVMAFILTNHSLSPLTRSNDPLANSLTVTTPRLIEWLTLGFGFHVEHHLFPAMSARHAPQVRALLLEHFRERYQSLPFLRATRFLHTRGRVYKDERTLIDPQSGREWPALTPDVEPVGCDTANTPFREDLPEQSPLTPPSPRGRRSSSQNAISEPE